MILRQFCKWLTVAAVLANSVFFIHGAEGDKVYLNAQGNLRRATYSTGDNRETFAIMSQDNARRLATGNEEQFVQIRYDENSHITSKTVWNITEGVATRESLEEYFYTPAQSQPQRRVKSDFIADVQEETLFLPSGKESRITIYSFTGAARGSLISRTDLRYDAQNRVIEETYMSKVDDVETVEISRFTYTSRSTSPNTELYRDGVLVHKTEYTAERNYTETFYFEGNFSAVVTIENGEKKQERFFFKGEEIKRNI
jgi:hypothetical protein